MEIYKLVVNLNAQVQQLQREKRKMKDELDKIKSHYNSRSRRSSNHSYNSVISNKSAPIMQRPSNKETQDAVATMEEADDNDPANIEDSDESMSLSE